MDARRLLWLNRVAVVVTLACLGYVLALPGSPQRNAREMREAYYAPDDVVTDAFNQVCVEVCDFRIEREFPEQCHFVCPEVP